MNPIPDAFSRAPRASSEFVRPGAISRCRARLSSPAPDDRVRGPVAATFRFAGLAAVVWAADRSGGPQFRRLRETGGWASAGPVRLARRRVREAIRVRRACLAYLTRVSLLSCAGIALLALTQDTHRLFGDTFYGVAPASVLFACVTLTAAAAGAVAAAQESASLGRLRSAARRLHPNQARLLAGQLRRLGDDDVADVLAVVLEFIPPGGGELVPAACPSGNSHEVTGADPGG